MRILILGGNGFIGSVVTAALVAHGHQVTALARDIAAASRRMPQARWLQHDIAGLTMPADWLFLLQEIDVVVNCAGALQDGLRDDVAALQYRAMAALYDAAFAASTKLIVQISARTDGSAADTPFLASKRKADSALKLSGVPSVILRPAMVVGRNAHGGSALLRALAAFPMITPLIHADTPLQFVTLNDVAGTVVQAVDGSIRPGTDMELAAPGQMTLAQAVARHRAWLGLPAARTVVVPPWLAKLTSAGADLLGRVGWRSPLRSTAISAAASGVTASSLPKTHLRLRTLDEMLSSAPAGVQDLWFARLYLLKPAIFGVLALFWILSGALALLSFEASAAHLAAAGFPAGLAEIATLLTSLADIGLGVGLLFRRYAGACLRGMIALSLTYLAGATILEPGLWLDPLGPLLKVLPSIGLSLVALATLEER